jgi:hypothetical protein
VYKGPVHRLVRCRVREKGERFAHFEWPEEFLLAKGSNRLCATFRCDENMIKNMS